MASTCFTFRPKRRGGSGTCNLFFAVLLICLASCRRTQPDSPPRSYRPQTTGNYSFDAPAGSQLQQTQSDNALSEWHTLQLDTLGSELYLTYTRLGYDRKLDLLIKDAEIMAFKHGRSAGGLSREDFADPRKHVAGKFYQLTGRSASPLQFYATDSSRHWLRGALYLPADSIDPARMANLKTDLKHLISTLKWNTDTLKKDTL